MRNVMLTLLLAWPVLMLPVTPRMQWQKVTQEVTPVVTLPQPDSCEPNDTIERACVLSVEAVSGPFSFVPSGETDYYSADLGETSTGQPLEVTVRATAGLDLRVTIARAGENTPLAVLESPALTTTLAADLTGWIVLHVENRAPADATNERYTIELRRVLPPPIASPVPGGEPAVAKPDALENNWSVDTASPIAVGVVYDLSFACPDSWPGACAGGDHDYVRVPVKAGSRYQLATFDLGPGVDTVVELFWNDGDHPVAANDDAFSCGFASIIQWRAPANGDLIVRVAPRNGATTPRLPAGTSTLTNSTGSNKGGAGSYRFAVALQGSDLAHQILERVAGAAGVTLPAAPPVASTGSTSSTVSASVPPAVPPASTDALKGDAIVIAPDGTTLREQPAPGAASIMHLAVERTVSLLGQSSGAWVRVQPHDGVVPGWVYGPDLRPLDSASSGITPTESPSPAEGGALPLSPGSATSVPTPTTTPPILAARVTRLAERPVSALPAPTAPAPLPLRVQLGIATFDTPIRKPAPGAPTPTLPPWTPLAGMRVQLVTVFGDLITEAVTPANGTLVFTRVADGTALRVRVPAAGLDVPIASDQTMLTIILPRGRP